MLNWIGGNRFLKKILIRFLPKTSVVAVTGNFRMHVDFRDLSGPSYYLLHGGPAAFYHYEERDKGEILSALPPDGVFLDVGANIGFFSFFVARLLPRVSVYAFEPHPLLSHCMDLTLRDSKISSVSVHRTCVSKLDGEIRLHLNTRDSGGHSTHSDQIDESDRKPAISTPSTSLDTFAQLKQLTRIDAIKIDVQGAEWDVLCGAMDSVKQFIPTMLIEIENRALVNPIAEITAVINDLYQLGYTVRRVASLNAVPAKHLFQLAAEELSSKILTTNYVFTHSTHSVE